jgi:hypothetical protein
MFCAESLEASSVRFGLEVVARVYPIHEIIPSTRAMATKQVNSNASNVHCEKNNSQPYRSAVLKLAAIIRNPNVLSLFNSYLPRPSVRPSFLFLSARASSFSIVASRTNAVFVGQYPSSSTTSSIFSTKGVGRETDKKALFPFFLIRLTRRAWLLDGASSLHIRLTTYNFKRRTSVTCQGMLDGAEPELVAFNLEPCFKSRCPLENSTCPVLDLHF